MLNEHTCPECGYRTPFYTCMRCGATIKTQFPEKDKPEPEHIPRHNQEIIPDPGVPLMSAAVAAGNQNPSVTKPASGVGGKKPNISFHYGKAKPPIKKATKYKGPPATLKYIFIVLGIALALLKMHSLLIQYNVLSPLVNLSSINNYRPNQELRSKSWYLPNYLNC